MCQYLNSVRDEFMQYVCLINEDDIIEEYDAFLSHYYNELDYFVYSQYFESEKEMTTFIGEYGLNSAMKLIIDEYGVEFLNDCPNMQATLCYAILKEIAPLELCWDKYKRMLE